MTNLLEVFPPFMRGGARHYIDGKRVSNHSFSGFILKYRENAGCSPDQVIHGVNKNKETTTRHYWYIDEKANYKCNRVRNLQKHTYFITMQSGCAFYKDENDRITRLWDGTFSTLVKKDDLCRIIDQQTANNNAKKMREI